MAQIVRVSLVKMVYSKFPSGYTPEPFLEIRAFVFVDRINTMLLKRIYKVLEDAIQEIIDKILPHIFLGREGKYTFLEQAPKTQISVKQLTRFYKVEIDGKEVEKIDLDELFTENLNWDGQPFTHFLFKKDRIERVLKGLERLHLTKLKVYRYMAFYDEDGRLKQDYDEGDIQGMMKRITIVEKRTGIIRNMLDKTTILMKSTSDELEKAIKDLENLMRKFR